MFSSFSSTAPRPARSRSGRRSAPALAVLLAALLTGCGLQKPEAPTFDTSLSIPAADEHYDAAQLIDAEDYLETDPGSGVPQFVVEGDFGRIDEIRLKKKAEYEAAGAKLTYTAFIAKAVRMVVANNFSNRSAPTRFRHRLKLDGSIGSSCCM